MVSPQRTLRYPYNKVQGPPIIVGWTMIVSTTPAWEMEPTTSSLGAMSHYHQAKARGASWLIHISHRSNMMLHNYLSSLWFKKNLACYHKLCIACPCVRVEDTCLLMWSTLSIIDPHWLSCYHLVLLNKSQRPLSLTWHPHSTISNYINCFVFDVAECSSFETCVLIAW
jgi:hypothetical protein